MKSAVRSLVATALLAAALTGTASANTFDVHPNTIGYGVVSEAIEEVLDR